MFVFSIIVCVLLLSQSINSTAVATSKLCIQNKTFSTFGTCINYPTNAGLCAGVLGGQPVYLPLGQPFFDQEIFVLTIMLTLRSNKGLVDDNCLKFGDAWACNNVWLKCRNATTVGIPEGIPALPCQSFCQDFWKACKVPFDQFNEATILGTKTFDVKDFSFPSCGPPDTPPGIGTFEQGPQPADVFGVRFIRALGQFPIGYNGSLRNPATSAKFTLANQTKVDVSCVVPAVKNNAVQLPAGLVPKQNCTFPLVLNAGGDTCVIPCPFPVIPVENQGLIEDAFTIPGFVALFLFLKSDIDTGEETSGTGTGNGKSGSRRRRNALRAATLYSLLGAILGMVFFFIGPMISVIRKTQVSCGENGQEINLGNVALGTADLSDNFCRAQRVAPFILQMLFNLILYAIVRVFLVVTEKARRMSDNNKLILDVLLVSYCAGIPVLFLIVASVTEGLSTDVSDFVTQFARNSAICVMRLSVGAEVILIFLPFILTGIMITGFSYYIYMHLNLISKNVAGLQETDKAKNSSAVALKLLMVRLSALGVFTFLVLIIFISASAALMAQMAAFAPKFNGFFGCEASKTSTCRTCQTEQALMTAAFPDPNAFAAQNFALSSITLLFGAFFSAQSFARLYKESMDGTLRVKVFNFCYGRPNAEAAKAYLESSMNSFATPLKSPGKSFNQLSENVVEAGEQVKLTFWALWYGRYRRWRQSYRGRARGPVFRWAKKAEKKKKFDFVPRAWDDKDNGVVEMSTDDSNWTHHTNSSSPWGLDGGKNMSAWNSTFDPRSAGGVAPPPSLSKQKTTNKVYEVGIEDDDDTPRRPPSRCPSI